MWLKVFRGKGKSLSDEELLAKFNSGGDLEALSELFSRYLNLVYGVCLRYLRNREESKDAVMMVFEKIASDNGRHQPENFKAWLFVVTKNYCLMQLRSATTERVRHDRWATEQVNFMESEPFLHPVDREERETDRALQECIEKLAGLQKESIELFYYKNKCYREIAEQLNTDEKRVKSLLQNAKRNLKICLEARDVR